MTSTSAAPSASYLLTTPVPVAELDPYGELKVAAQIRLMQLAAARATARAGFDGRWYDENGVTWVVRYTHIERLAPARHDDDLSIRTWVSDFRRVRSWRHYEMSRGDGELVARARTDWVYVETTDNSPAAVPENMQRAFMPQGVVTEPRPKRLRPDLDGEAILLRCVEWPELDALGHVNNSAYAGYVEQAVLEKLAACGWRPDVTAATRFRLESLELEYLTPALFRQQLGARVGLRREPENGVVAEVEILTDGTPAVRAVARYGWNGPGVPEPIADKLRS